MFFFSEGAFGLRGVLAKRGIFTGGRSWPEGGFGRKEVLSGGEFCLLFPKFRRYHYYEWSVRI